MNLFDMQGFLANSAFSLSLVLLPFYWIEAAFFSKSKYHNFGVFGTALVTLSLTLLLVIRWIEVKHFPLSNLYESLIFLSLSFTFAQILIDRTTNNTFAGVVVSPIVLLTTTFGSFTLPAELQKGTSLVPALQSNWLMMHVTIMMLSYAALIVGSLFAFVFLILTQLKANVLFDVPGNFSIKHPFNGTLNGIESTFASNRSLRQHQAENEGIVSCAKQEERRASLGKSGEGGWLPEGVGGSLYHNLLATNHHEQQFENPVDESLSNSNSTAPKRLVACQATTTNTIVASQPLIKQHFGNQKTAFSKPTAIRKQRREDVLKRIDNLSYRVLGLGFPLLTIGILSGSVWANEAWGSYWSWDPKETWAFITWLVYAIYLHTRITKGWTGKKPAIIATIGFVVVWVCYLGVNLISKGLHSYGWMQS